MDATAGWSAIVRLRAWEVEQLGLTTGQRLLDVGCGLGDAGLALATGLGEDGELVGSDASGQMIAAARSRASGVSCPVRFSVGDAQALEEPDNSFVVGACASIQYQRRRRSVTAPEVEDAAVAHVSNGVDEGGLLHHRIGTCCA